MKLIGRLKKERKLHIIQNFHPAFPQCGKKGMKMKFNSFWNCVYNDILLGFNGGWKGLRWESKRKKQKERGETKKERLRRVNGGKKNRGE